MLNFLIPGLSAAIENNLNLDQADVLKDTKKSFQEKEILKKDCLKDLLEISKAKIYRKKAQKDLSILHQDQNIVLQKQKSLLQIVVQKKKEKEVIDETKSLQSKIIFLYKRNLGFRIEKIKTVDTERNEYPIRFTFDNIKNNPQKYYSLELSTDGKNYKVLSCNPVIDSLDELISALCKSNDLSKFIIQVRRKFSSISATNKTD